MNALGFLSQTRSTAPFLAPAVWEPSYDGSGQAAMKRFFLSFFRPQGFGIVFSFAKLNTGSRICQAQIFLRGAVVFSWKKW